MTGRLKACTTIMIRSRLTSFVLLAAFAFWASGAARVAHQAMDHGGALAPQFSPPSKQVRITDRVTWAIAHVRALTGRTCACHSAAGVTAACASCNDVCAICLTLAGLSLGSMAAAAPAGAGVHLLPAHGAPATAPQLSAVCFVALLLPARGPPANPSFRRA
jgi:hypothetical protein